jgi:TPR repeat protein
MPAARPVAPPPATALTTPGAVPALGPQRAPLDPPTTPAFAAPAAPITPFEAFRSGTTMLKQGEREKAVQSLEYAAEQGVTQARWKLARMYQEGDGVDQSNLRAFEYYSSIADASVDDMPAAAQAPFVASAFVALGHYYREGIPDSPVKVDGPRARRMYLHAATYFGDAEAQYHYARMVFEGAGGTKDPRRAAQWFNAAANKGQVKAQAMLGRILFKGEPGVPRQASRGLMWLALARANAGPTETWIADSYDAAYKQATEEERGQAAEFLLRWMDGRRE